MTIREEWNGDILTVIPEGRIDTLTSRDLEKFLYDRYDRAQKLILEFAGVEYISSAGLRVLVQAYKRMKDKDGIVIRNVCEDVMQVFTLTGYNHVIRIE